MARGRINPIQALTEVNPVKIKRQNLLFIELKFQPDRQKDFFDFAAKITFWGQKQVFGKLLGDGATTLGNTANREVGPCRAGDAQKIDAKMIVEPTIFNGNESFANVIGKITHLDRVAISIAIGRKCCAVDAHDPDRGFAFAGNVETDFIGQPISEIGHHTAAQYHDPNGTQNGKTNKGVWPRDQSTHPRKQTAFAFAAAACAFFPLGSFGS